MKFKGQQIYIHIVYCSAFLGYLYKSIYAKDIQNKIMAFSGKFIQTTHFSVI